MIELGAHLLGRTVEHDPHNWDHQQPVRQLGTPGNVLHTLSAPCLNQGKIGSCEGNTAVEFLNTVRAVNNRAAYRAKQHLSGSRYLTETVAVGMYSLATTLDNDGIPGVYPPVDTGTSGVGIAKAMQALGGITAYNWTFTWAAFLATLQRQPIMLGTNWYDSMFQTDADGFVIAPNPNDTPAGGHAYLAIALDYTSRLAPRVGCTNHWTDKWGTTIGGRKGRFWISFNLLRELLIHEQGDSLVPVLM